jgi:hypothetical protein
VLGNWRDWRWVFFINASSSARGCFVLPPTKDLPHGARFDWNGAPLIAAALMTVMVVLNEGYAWGASLREADSRCVRGQSDRSPHSPIAVGAEGIGRLAGSDAPCCEALREPQRLDRFVQPEN